MAEYNPLENAANMFMSYDKIKLIRQIWVLVEPQRVDHFTEILIRLFQRYPDVQAQFVRLLNDDMDAIRQSRIARAIGCRVGISLRAIISTLERADLVDHALKPIKINHRNRRVDIEEFKKIKIIIREYFIEHLLGAVPIEAIDSFDLLMDKIVARLQSPDFVVDSPADLTSANCQVSCSGGLPNEPGDCSGLSCTLQSSDLPIMSVNRSNNKARPMAARSSHGASPWQLARRWFCWGIDKQTKQ